MLLAHQASLGKVVIDKLCKAEKTMNNFYTKGQMIIWELCCGMYDNREASKECKVIR